MIQVVLIICVLLVLILIKWPKPGMYLYKAVCLTLLLSALFLAFFFSLRALNEISLNIALHPWREYVMFRFLYATVFAAVIFVVSQIPFLFVRQFDKKEKQRMVKVEGLIYLCILAIGAGLCYYEEQGHDYPENKIISQINIYRDTYGHYPDSITPTTFQGGYVISTDSLNVRYWHDKSSFTILAQNIYGKYIYDSQSDLWSYIPNEESEKDSLVAKSIDKDDIIFIDCKKVEGFGVSETEFFKLSQSQYERARQLLTQYFTDFIQPFENGKYLIEHPNGLEYKAYPYDKYIRQYFGWRDSSGTEYAYVILISKKELEHNKSYNPDELFFMDGDVGGSDAVDVLINLDENKLEQFGVHQES